MNLSPSQQTALNAIQDWLSLPAGAKNQFILTGAAGTGKSTLLDQVRTLPAMEDAIYLAPTGKAALRVRETTGMPATTIHSAIYNLVRGGRSPQFEYNEERFTQMAIVDESSMLTPEVVADLRQAFHRILYVGDPFQLPPVKGVDWLNSQKADASLTEVHRQALDSPILSLATAIRNGAPLPVQCSSEDLTITSLTPAASKWEGYDQILVHTNAQRTHINDTMRKLLGRKQEFESGDKLVNLANRTVEDLYIANGSILTVKKVTPFTCILEHDGQELEAWISRDPQTLYKRTHLYVDYAYALTVHKAQGSQWDSVLLLTDQIKDPKDRRRWRYTGVTRAAKRLTWVKPS